MIRNNEGLSSSYVQNEPFELRSYIDGPEEPEDMINRLVTSGLLTSFFFVLLEPVLVLNIEK